MRCHVTRPAIPGPGEGAAPERTNQKRADDAYRLMLVWRERLGREVDWDCDIRDLIADLLHLSTQYCADPQEEVMAALDHFKAERRTP